MNCVAIRVTSGDANALRERHLEKGTVARGANLSPSLVHVLLRLLGVAALGWQCGCSKQSEEAPQTEPHTLVTEEKYFESDEASVAACVQVQMTAPESFAAEVTPMLVAAIATPTEPPGMRPGGDCAGAGHFARCTLKVSVEDVPRGTTASVAS